MLTCRHKFLVFFIKYNSDELSAGIGTLSSKGHFNDQTASSCHHHVLLNEYQPPNSYWIDSREDSPAVEEHWFMIQELPFPNLLCSGEQTQLASISVPRITQGKQQQFSPAHGNIMRRAGIKPLNSVRNSGSPAVGQQPPDTTQSKYLLLDPSHSQSTSLIAAVNISTGGTKKMRKLVIADQTLLILS